MTSDSSAAEEATGGKQRLAILPAMAMFVLVVDTSLMNVSIAAGFGTSTRPSAASSRRSRSRRWSPPRSS
jgi:hypothetical protein